MACSRSWSNTPAATPLISAGPQGGVGDLVAEDCFDTHPGAAGHQPDEHPPQAQPVGDPRAMAAQGMGPRCRRDPRLNRRPDGIKHFGLECAHDDRDLHLVVVRWVALGIKPEPTRRPVTYPRGSLLSSVLSSLPESPARNSSNA